MKRKIMIIMFCLFFMTGCSHGIGSFEKGDLDLNAFFTDINKQIGEETFHMPLLNDQAWSKKNVEKKYHMDMTILEDCMVKSSLVDLQTAEIAIFKAPKEKDARISKGIHYRLDILHKSSGSYNEEIKNWIHNAKQGRIGEYYYFVLGEDSEKVVNYMKNGA